MNIENKRIVEQFVSSWKVASPERIAPEIESVFNETNRKKDDSYLVLANGRLVDDRIRQEVKIDRSTYLGRMDGEFFDELEKWARENDDGRGVWISPSYEEKYPCNKIVVYEIAYTFGYPSEKVVLSTTILFDTPKDHCTEVAGKIDEKFKDVNDPEFLRNKLLDANGGDLINVLEAIMETGSENPTPSQELIAYFVNQIKAEVDPKLIVLEMQQKGVIGEHSISCPPGIIGILGAVFNSTRTLNFNNEKQILECVKCPFCEETVDAEVYDGKIHCPKCGKEA